MDKQSHITALVEKIERYNKAYREGNPEISDKEYDSLIDELRSIDPNNEWFASIEPAPVKQGRKRKLPIPMKSLNKAKDIHDVMRWAESLGLPKKAEVVCVPKFDGLSLLVDEIAGTAYSRGGSENEGQDCIEHIIAADIIKGHDFHYTFGEFMISNAQWGDHFKGKRSPSTGEEYKSPRNTAAGMLNADTPTNLIQHTTFFRYGVGQVDISKFNSYFGLIHTLCSSFNQPFVFVKATIGELSESLLKELFISWSSIYPMDGIVIYINDLDTWERVGRHQTTGNPLYAIAYKHPDFTEAFKTVVKDITWKVSKSGALKPVVNIEKVNTGDCEMENPTGYNAAWINDMQIAKGAEILVTRSGGVIPKILSTITPATEDEQCKLWDQLSECPSCGSPTGWNSSMIELCCTNPNCSGKRLAEIVHFFNICGAENMGEESYTKLFNAGFDSIKKILNISYGDILSIEGFGESTAEIILNNNKKILDGVDAATLMQASNKFVGIGKVKAQSILDKLNNNLNDVVPSNDPQTSKTMVDFYNGLPSFKEFVQEVNIPLIYKEKKEGTVGGRFSGMKVCFTNVRDAELEAAIIAEGGVVSSGVSKQTTLLIVADMSANTTKTQKAVNFGVPIIPIADFKSKYRL